MPMDAAILTQGLTKYYGKRPGVLDVDLEVRPGEVFGFLGPNGAGKTTTIRTLMDLIRPTSGRALVLGMDAQQQGVEIRRRVGYLPGDLSLDEHLTSRELLEFFSSLRGGVHEEDIERLASLLDAELDARIGSLSRGNRQKIGMVQAFMHRPDLLLLDEPTAGLDPLIQQHVYRLLEETKAEGRTVFLSSHNLPEVERTCDRVGIIRGGRLVAVEDVREIRSRALREMEIHFAGPAPADGFARLPGVREAHTAGGSVRLKVEGRVDAVVKEAAKHTVVSITTRQPTLEEIFLAFYGEEDPGEEEPRG